LKIKKNRKGVAVLLVVVIAALLIEGIILTNFIQRTEHLIRAIREAEIIQATNNIEFSKKSLQQALAYSTYQGYYNVAGSGGYADLKNVDSYDCTAYLRVYDTTYFPENYENNLHQGILNVLNSYAEEINYPSLTIPEYTKVEINEKKINVSSAGDFEHKADLFEIKNEPTISAEFDFEIKKMFEFARDNFIVNDRIGNEVRTSSDHNDAIIKIANLESAIQNEISSLGDYEISLIPFKLSSEDSNFVLRVLVRIADKSNEYSIHDISDNSTMQRNIEMNFYVLTGKGEQRLPETNECKNAILI